MSHAGRQAPKVFISHGSEDKERFVLRFAGALLSAGINAWVDQWEIKPGDSLVQRIFEEGIGQADAFIVVLSNISISKPWVREELDAGVVRRITTNRDTRLIPVLLDENVPVPVALQHLLWASVPKDGFDGVVQQVVDQIYGLSRKPRLGTAPTYTKTELHWTTNSADETIFQLITEKLTQHDGPGWVLYSNDVEAQAAAAGISGDQFNESMHALINGHLVRADVMAGGRRFRIHSLPDSIWLQIQQAAGLSVDVYRRQILAAVVNENRNRLRSGDFGLGFYTIGAILRSFESEKILTVKLVANGDFVISGVSPLAWRALKS